jgi:hypothetical protein
MALIGSLSKPLMSTRGALGQLSTTIVQGLGGGAAVNVLDKVALQGKLTSIGVTIPFNIPTTTTPLRLNLTDLGYVMLVNGLKIPKGKNLIWMALGLGLKKFAEAKNWIDPPEWGYPSAASTSAGRLSAPEPMPMISSGGLTHT